MIVSAFADEIAADLAGQLAVLERHGIGHVDLRAVGDGNVIELDDARAVALRDELLSHGLSVATVASPIGKEPADADPAGLRRRMIRAASVAHLLGTDLVRVFGFQAPGGGDDWRDASLRSLRVLASCAREGGVTLLLENEVGTAADTVAHTTDLLASLADDHVRAAFDPANALRCGEQPYPDGYGLVKRWLRQVHVKDLDDDGRVVPAGFGAADWPGLLDALRRDGYGGLISLEPHLLRAGRRGGFTGPTLFGEAHRALQALVTGNSPPTAGAWKRRSMPLTLRTVPNTAASRRARAEELFVQPDGTVLEAPAANVFWATDGLLKTPALDLGILSSSTRTVIMEALDTLEVSAPLDEVLAADEVFLASTSGEIQPVGRIDEAEYETPGPLCRAAGRALEEAIARDGREAEEER